MPSWFSDVGDFISWFGWQVQQTYTTPADPNDPTVQGYVRDIQQGDAYTLWWDQLLGGDRFKAALGIVQRDNPSQYQRALAAMGQQPAAARPAAQAQAAQAGTAGGTPTGQGPGPTGQVPQPFGSEFFGRRTEEFGQAGPFGSHEFGNDYAMPVGTPIITPFGGTIVTEDRGHADWGKRVFVVMPNGWRFAVGHMTRFAVGDGQSVAPGTVVGYSGGDPSDPSSGASTGPHVEVQMISPDNNYVDPYPMLQQIYQPGGVSYQALQGGGFLAASTGVAMAPPATVYRTPDGYGITEGTAQDRWYKMVDAVWTKTYGAHAPYWAAQALSTTGVQTVDELDTLMQALPSGVGDLSIGEYSTAKTNVQSQASKYLGRPVPDALIKQLASEGKTTPDAVSLWFLSHPASDIPTDQFAAVYDAANQWTQSVWGQPPDPNQVYALWQQAGGQPTPPPDPNAPIPEQKHPPVSVLS